jgi:hypothetical protein
MRAYSQLNSGVWWGPALPLRLGRLQTVAAEAVVCNSHGHRMGRIDKVCISTLAKSKWSVNGPDVRIFDV